MCCKERQGYIQEKGLCVILSLSLKKAKCSTAHFYVLNVVWHPGNEVAANIKGSINKFKSCPEADIDGMGDDGMRRVGGDFKETGQ